MSFKSVIFHTGMMKIEKSFELLLMGSFRPTASFSLSNVVMRHDVPDVGPMSEQYPHLIFSNLTSKLGQRTTNILKYLFPVPKEDSHRTITFVNQDDYISFR